MPETSVPAKCSENTACSVTDTFFAVICDDQLFIKITPQGEAAFPDLPKAPSHEGASDSFVIEDVDDPTMAVELTRITCEALRKAASQSGGNEYGIRL